MRILNTVRPPVEARVKRETPGPLVRDAKYTSVSYDWHLVSNYPGFRNFIIIIFSFNPDAVHAPTVIYSPVSPACQPRLRRQPWRRRYRFGGNRRPRSVSKDGPRRWLTECLQRKFDRKWEMRRHLNCSRALT